MASDNERCFTLFPKFPKELRLKIWKYALPGPRIIKIRYNCNDGPGPIDLVHRVKCRATIPAMLHVNAEAREVAHKTYKPLFAQNLGHPIFFDLDNDFAYFEDENAFEAWTGWNYVKHFDENDPSHFRWELRNIIVHSSILRIMNLLGIVKSPLRVMRSLSKLAIQHQSYPLSRDCLFGELMFLLRGAWEEAWEEVHGQDVPFPKCRFIKLQEIEGIMAGTDTTTLQSFWCLRRYFPTIVWDGW